MLLTKFRVKLRIAFFCADSLAKYTINRVKNGLIYRKIIVSIIPTNITSDKENKTGKFFMRPSLQKSVSLYLENFPFI